MKKSKNIQCSLAQNKEQKLGLEFTNIDQQISNHPHSYETPLKQNQKQAEKIIKDNIITKMFNQIGFNKKSKFNVYQRSTLPQELHYENDFENQKISEYSLEGIRREDHFEDKITNTLYIRQLISTKSYQIIFSKQNKELKQEPQSEKPGLALNLLNAFNQQKYGQIKYLIKLQQEAQAEYFNYVEYEKITLRHLKLIEKIPMKDPYYVRLVKLSEFERLNYELQLKLMVELTQIKLQNL